MIWNSSKAVLLLLEQGLCPLALVRPQDELDVEITIDGRAISSGSLIRVHSSQQCSEKGLIGAELLSDVYFYRTLTSDSFAGEFCISEQFLSSIEDIEFYGLRTPDGKMNSHSGKIVSKSDDSGQCDSELLWNRPKSELKWLMPLSSEQVEQVLLIQDKWMEKWGEWALGRVWMTHWGYVSLPVQYFSKSEIEDQYRIEELFSVEQQEKAIIAQGPQRLWFHFLGTDALYSDLWGRVEVIDWLINLLEKWEVECLNDASVSNKASCIPQIGDITWYNSRRPDPLGHKEHYLGNCVDFRLFRSDSSRYEAYWNKEDDRNGFESAYDQGLTMDFIGFSSSLGAGPILFNDPISSTQKVKGHDDHVHICYSPKGSGF